LRGNQYFLFNYKKDPGETNNLMDKLGKENSIVQKLTTELDEQRKKIY